jgi:hypothetical protein
MVVYLMTLPGLCAMVMQVTLFEAPFHGYDSSGGIIELTCI